VLASSFLRPRSQRIVILATLAGSSVIATIGAATSAPALLTIGVAGAGVTGVVLAKALLESLGRAANVVRDVDGLTGSLGRTEAELAQLRADAAVTANRLDETAASLAVRLDETMRSIGGRVDDLRGRVDALEQGVGAANVRRRHVIHAPETFRELGLRDALKGLAPRNP
jgi:hypothetical protein